MITLDRIDSGEIQMIEFEQVGTEVIDGRDDDPRIRPAILEKDCPPRNDSSWGGDGSGDWRSQSD